MFIASVNALYLQILDCLIIGEVVTYHGNGNMAVHMVVL